MNIFYAPPEQVYGSHLELSGQEAKHASRVLRYREGDAIEVVDGQGGWRKGNISRITDSSVQVEIQDTRQIDSYRPRLILGMGLIKKRDRLEFAVEKAVELGVSEIALFRSRHTVKENVRMDRLEMTILSAMKQSLRAWLPKVSLYSSLKEVLEAYPDSKPLIAHKKNEDGSDIGRKLNEEKSLLLLVGPEGGFSEEEIELATGEKGAEIISLGSYRLRAETAVVTFLSRFV